MSFMVLKLALNILFMTHCLDSNETSLIIVANFLTLAKLFLLLHLELKQNCAFFSGNPNSSHHSELFQSDKASLVFSK